MGQARASATTGMVLQRDQEERAASPPGIAHPCWSDAYDAQALGAERCDQVMGSMASPLRSVLPRS